MSASYFDEGLQFVAFIIQPRCIDLDLSVVVGAPLIDQPFPTSDDMKQPFFNDPLVVKMLLSLEE